MKATVHQEKMIYSPPVASNSKQETWVGTLKNGEVYMQVIWKSPGVQESVYTAERRYLGSDTYFPDLQKV